MKEPPQRIFYVAGPGSAISAHENWRRGIHDPTEVSITFSAQIEQYAQDIGAKLYIVCYNKNKNKIVDGQFTIEHLPKPLLGKSGLSYHLGEFIYGIQMLARAVSMRADTAILDSGCTHYFMQSLFAAFGIKVVPVLHNTLWPNGFKPSHGGFGPKNLVNRTIAFLDRLFWRNVPTAVLCVSPICERQVREIAGDHSPPLVQVRAQFEPGYFAAIQPPPPHEKRPFTIMFIGRVVASKGVFDILEIAERVEKAAPGQVRWIICGTGGDFEELRNRRDAMGLVGVVDLRGWTSLEDLADVYAKSHCSIVPTRSSFNEGLAMTAAESALAGRPVITNPVVPALEILEACSVACKTNDPSSYVDQILKLIGDPDWYARMARNARPASQQFLDRSFGLTQVLKRTLGG